MAHQAGTILDKTEIAGYMPIQPLMDNFQIKPAGLWRHNGANDAVMQMTVAVLVVLFPVLYPTTPELAFPMNTTIDGQSINEIWADLAKDKENMPVLTSGFSQYCFYCETAEDHEPDECPTNGQIVCKMCSSATGTANKPFRDRVHHQTSRCTFKYKHDLNLSLEVKRQLSQGMATKDLNLIGDVSYNAILKGGPMGDDEVKELEEQEIQTLAEDEAARLEFEGRCYKPDSPVELDGDEER